MAYYISWVNYFYARTIAHEYGIHLKVNDNIYFEDMTSVFNIFTNYLLWVMYWFCFYIFALFFISPETNPSRSVPYVLADTDYIIKDMLWVKVWIFSEWNINRFNADDSIKTLSKRITGIFRDGQYVLQSTCEKLKIMKTILNGWLSLLYVKLVRICFKLLIRRLFPDAEMCEDVV